MTAPREVLPERIYLLTRNCTQRQFLLRPDGLTNSIFAFCLAVAAAREGIGLIAWCAMSNHYHAVVYDPRGRLPAFLEHFHKMLARALNVRWGRSENLWATEQTSVVHLPTPEAVFEKVCYVLINPMKAQLVDRLVDWPGITSLHHLDGRSTKHPRPKVFFRENGPVEESAELAAVQPPCSRVVESAVAWAERVRVAVAEAEHTLRQTRLREGERIEGRKAVLERSPFDKPRSPRPRRKLNPTLAGRERGRFLEELKRLRDFYVAYASARLRFLAGELAVLFPAGTVRFRALGANCAPYPALAHAA